MAITKKKTVSKSVSKPVTVVSTANLQGLARAGYMYLATFLGLVALALGATGLINVLMESTVLPPVVYSYNVRSAISDELNVSVRYTTNNEEIVSAPTMAQAQAAVKKADEKVNNLYKLNTAERNRALSLSIVFVVVGGAIYFWHRKETLELVQSAKSKV